MNKIEYILQYFAYLKSLPHNPDFNDPEKVAFRKHCG